MTAPPVPDVSFAVACYNCAPYLEEAVASALGQTGVAVEVLLVDDGSSDGTLPLAQRLAAHDPRVRVFTTPANLGPGGARNIALTEMHGTWLAVLDSDDLVAPDRSARLIAEAEASGAGMIADDLVVFGEGVSESRFLGAGATEAEWILLERYFADSAIFGGAPNPGFLKPMIRRDLLLRTGIRYDERLRIAEDDDLIVRLLLAGARYRLLRAPLYRYRKHGASISHRLSRDHVDRMAAAGADLRARARRDGFDGPAFRRRDRALSNAVAFTHAIDALKQRRPLAAAVAVVRTPGCLPLFAMPLAARLRRLGLRRRGG